MERTEVGEFARGAKAIVALPVLGNNASRDVDARLAEAAGLAEAIGVVVAERLPFRVRNARAATLFGSGQVEAIAQAAKQAEAELIIIDAPITPIQQRNLEDATKVKVIDRTGLILEIFGERAATAEGRLQVELAHLDYQAGRLVRSWTHLERQRGGFGFLGGPGETQIEADRRLIRDRMAKLRRELEQVSRTRGLHRKRRQKAPWPVVALVGYTNAGKSSLFNRLTNSSVSAEDMLFATLDPTMREIALPGFDKAILSDTVGFISDLPTQLVAAFRATLEEVVSADLIIHVRDIAHPDSEAQRQDVERVLVEIGAVGEGAAAPGRPMIEAWNKIDLLAPDAREHILAMAARKSEAVPISALTGEGVEGLLEAVSAQLRQGNRIRAVRLPSSAGAAIAWLHANGEIIDRQSVELETRIEVRLSDADWARFQALHGATEALLESRS